MIIVVGGSSYIGKHLYNHFKKKGLLSVGTFYNTSIEGMKFFDLQKPDINNLEIDLDEIDHAIICSAMARIDECKKNKEKSERINVTGMKDLLNQLFNNDIKPIFFSSDQVFNGEKGNYLENDLKNPVNVYGMQKKEIEDFLMSSDKCYTICRISKIFGLEKNDKTLLTSWIEDLLADKKIYCAVDQVLSFTWVKDIVGCIDILINNDLNGCYNVCSPEYFSRFELANLIKKDLNITTGEVLPCSIRDFDFVDQRALNTSLNPSKFISDTGFKFTSIHDCLNKLKKIYDL